MTDLEEFKGFLKEYRETWNGCDATKMNSHASKSLKVRWSDEDDVSDWGFEEAFYGWKEAYDSLRDENPKWYFEDILTELNKSNEAVSIFWVTCEINGKLIDEKLLFNETFHKEQGKWKKIREYVQKGF